MNEKSLKTLKYGDPTKEHIEKMNRETDLFSISFRDIRYPAPPSNDSDVTRSDLNKTIASLKSQNREDSEFFKLSDKKPLEVFKSFATENNLRYDDEYMKELKKQIASFVLNLKYQYNRPRPFQLARHLGIPFENYSFTSANTPSYPSGHALQAQVFSNILSRLNPNYERSLENIADRISLGRIQSGVHFPGDISAAKDIANIVDQYIDGPSKHRGIVMEIDYRAIVREFLLESPGESPEKLRILDFDDTIANTVERVIITTDNGKGQKLISSEDFAVYDLKPGESIDPDVAFEEFERVDVKKATPVPVVSDMLKNFAVASGNRKLLILTARSQSVADDVMNFLQEKLGIQNPEGVIDFVGVASKEPAAKVEIIQKYLDSNPSINFVSFYDDSGKNVRAVHDFLDSRGFSRGRDQRDVRQVVKDEDGNVRLVSPSDTNESFDYREMTRSFLYNT